MRVISQKGIEPTVDLPYEQATLTVNGKFISAIVPGVATMLIAAYSTPEKAKKVMEKLWDAQDDFNIFVFRFPEDSEV